MSFKLHSRGIVVAKNLSGPLPLPQYGILSASTSSSLLLLINKENSIIGEIGMKYCDGDKIILPAQGVVKSTNNIVKLGCEAKKNGTRIFVLKISKLGISISAW